MRERILSKYNFVSQILIIFSVTVLFISVIGKVNGDSAKEFSTLFQLGNNGIAFSTLFQLLTTSIIISFLRSFFFSEEFFINMMILWRSVLMVLSIIIVIIVYVIVFDWFPINYGPAWVGFFLSFGGCFTVSTILIVVKTHLEGKKYDKLLKDYNERKLK